MASSKKFHHKKVEEEYSPQQNLKDISVSDFKLPKQSGNKEKRTPNKENLNKAIYKKTHSPFAPAGSASMGKRRQRNDRSASKVEKT